MCCGQSVRCVYSVCEVCVFPTFLASSSSASSCSFSCVSSVSCSSSFLLAKLDSCGGTEAGRVSHEEPVSGGGGSEPAWRYLQLGAEVVPLGQQALLLRPPLLQLHRQRLLLLPQQVQLLRLGSLDLDTG